MRELGRELTIRLGCCWNAGSEDHKLAKPQNSAFDCGHMQTNKQTYFFRIPVMSIVTSKWPRMFWRLAMQSLSYHVLWVPMVDWRDLVQINVAPP